MNTAQLRAAFLDFFVKKGHTVVPSSSLIPFNDPTLLFTNAGMVQFKDVFLGQDKRDYSRATSSQRCLRAGGKHNDLENVGFTARHHTFFEMLGNFSFGDYFKREAIEYAWEFVTQVLKLPPERLWVTVFKDDDEAADIWLNEIGVSKERFSRCDEKDNFWAMGDTGPCGPCSEIFYDHGPEIAGGPPGSKDADGDRYIEIWNLVFMQFNRDSNGNLSPLPKPSVDTGMGLERTAAIMQGVHNNYEIDLFQHLIQAIAALANTKEFNNKSLRVIADHLRACSFLVVDGVLPNNEGRGYVLRRIMRRAIRHGHKVGMPELFFYKLVPALVKEMGGAFPELVEHQDNIIKVFKQEEIQFAKTLNTGLGVFEATLKELQGTIIPGEAVFKLYDTYGFPIDLTADIAREHDLTIDIAGFESAMQEQRDRARNASNFNVKQQAISTNTNTEFTGYEKVSDCSIVTEIFIDNKSVAQLEQGAEGFVILNNTPFYAESGGQVGDTGKLSNESGVEFIVLDTLKFAGAFTHVGKNLGNTLKVGDKLNAHIDTSRREKIKANHSATHLLHAALRSVLGDSVTQKGSVVDPNRLRFDFTYNEPLTLEQIKQVENLVNQKIIENTATKIDIMDTKDAMALGAMALFGEKYGDKVRVLHMGGDFSVELCGGTHTERTGDVGYFKIISQTGSAAGVRRVEALTGLAAVAYSQNQEQLIDEIALELKSAHEEIPVRVAQLHQKIKQLEKQNALLQSTIASGGSKDIISDAQDIKGIKVLAATLPVGDARILREAIDKYKQQLKTAVVVLASVENNRITLAAGVTKDCVDKINAGLLINHVAQQVGGKGGGRADMAQAGGDRPDKLPEALKTVYKWVENNI